MFDVLNIDTKLLLLQPKLAVLIQKHVYLGAWTFLTAENQWNIINLNRRTTRKLFLMNLFICVDVWTNLKCGIYGMSPFQYWSILKRIINDTIYLPLLSFVEYYVNSRYRDESIDSNSLYYCVWSVTLMDWYTSIAHFFPRLSVWYTFECRLQRRLLWLDIHLNQIFTWKTIELHNSWIKTQFLLKRYIHFYLDLWFVIDVNIFRVYSFYNFCSNFSNYSNFCIDFLLFFLNDKWKWEDLIHRFVCFMFL